MTMMNMPLNIVRFANNDPDRLSIYEGMKDFFTHTMSERQGKDYGSYDNTLTLSQKEEKLNTHLFSEIERISGVPREGMDILTWSKNPLVKWAIESTQTAIIEAIIPDAIIHSIGIYSDIENVDFGQTATFDIKPNALMSTSQSGNSQRTAWVQKQYETSVTLTPVNHNITVQASFYKVLAGKESLADFMRKAVISIERDMSSDAYTALTTLLSTESFPSAFVTTGFSSDTALTLAQKVTTYNNSNKATFVGTTKALSNIFPNSAKGYRVVTDSSNMTMQLLQDFYGYSLLELPQVPTGAADFGLTLNDNQIYVISPSSDKIIKGVIEGSVLSNSSDYYDNANLTSSYTINKRWVFAAVTNSKMGVINIA